MRHRMSGRQLNRDSSSRKALFRSLAIALVNYETIKTTLPKAKELRSVVEPLITLAKVNNLANRRLALARLANKEAVDKLFNDVAPRFVNRNGGYTRILKCGLRTGDKVPMAYVQLVEEAVSKAAE